jgi:hypothetical protein
MVRTSKCALALLAVAVVLATCADVFAAHQIARGTLTSAAGNQMVLTDEGGKEWTLQLVDGAMIICPGAKEARITDIKAGAPVSVLWLKKGDQFQAFGVLHREGDYKDADLAVGKFKSGDNKQLVITDDKGKDFSYLIDANTRIRYERFDQ